MDLKMSLAYHPQTDGASERTNKTVNQSLHYFIERNQKGWVKALPKVHFNMMNTVNASTGLSPFVLRMGKSPHVLPPLIPAEIGETVGSEEWAEDFIARLTALESEAKDALLASKVSQAEGANRNR